MGISRTAVDSTGPEDAAPLAELNRIARDYLELRRREHHHVLVARAQGYSWQAIAAVMGVSKQAMHRRYKGYRADGG